MSYLAVPDLIDLICVLGEKQHVREGLKMSRTTVTYTLTHGLAHGMQKELFDKLKDTPFSLNVDEATNNAMDKVVNSVVRFYDVDQFVV